MSDDPRQSRRRRHRLGRHYRDDEDGDRGHGHNILVGITDISNVLLQIENTPIENLIVNNLTATTINTTNINVTQNLTVEGDTTLRGPVNITEGPTTIGGPVHITEGPTIVDGNTTFTGPVNITEGPTTVGGPVNITEGPTTVGGPVHITEGPTIVDGNATFNGPVYAPNLIVPTNKATITGFIKSSQYVWIPPTETNNGFLELRGTIDLPVDIFFFRVGQLAHAVVQSRPLQQPWPAPIEDIYRISQLGSGSNSPQYTEIVLEFNDYPPGFEPIAQLQSTTFPTGGLFIMPIMDQNDPDYNFVGQTANDQKFQLHWGIHIQPNEPVTPRRLVATNIFLRGTNYIDPYFGHGSRLFTFEQYGLPSYPDYFMFRNDILMSRSTSFNYVAQELPLPFTP